jgi:arylsulfatase A-like enzyme
MWIHYLDPHAPYAPPEPFARMYVGDTLYDETKRVNLIAPDLSYPDIGGVQERARLGDNDVLDYYVSQYDGEIRYADENVGALLSKMKDLGLYDETLIIFTSDHGESLGDHNHFFWHGRLPYNECLRVPLVIKFPNDSVPSSHVHHPVGLIDLLPTVLDFLNLPFPTEGENMEGNTLIPLVKAGVSSAPHSVYSEAGYGEGHQRILIKGQWKLIYVPNTSIQKIMNNVPFELYNMQDDKRELKNLVEVEPLVVEELKKELVARMENMKIIDERPSAESVEVDPETAEALKSLGYVQ